ncbi:hypothetical protein FBY13_103295 [Pantoea sp. SJZ147]|nr:hypothetical protein FBY13_103295 [Pantoea sp. SJZ147]
MTPDLDGADHGINRFSLSASHMHWVIFLNDKAPC